jgi:alkylation response protein AidB-like acyl-CoA dehydrogenase
VGASARSADRCRWLPIAGRVAHLVWYRRRYRCRGCGRTFHRVPLGAPPRQRTTRRFRRRLFERVRGGAANAESERRPFGTTVERADGGWTVTGTKVFATSATGADWAILVVNTAGPGGARHATDAGEGLLMLACPLADPTVSVDGSWWDPVGMRATVSHMVRFDATYVPDSDVIGAPGSFLREGWQTAFTPHYGASFLGAAEAAYEYARGYLTHQGKGGDPYVQQRVGSMLVNLEAAHLWLHYVARLWDAGEREQAQLSGSHARHVIEHLTEETLHHCIRACGARSLVRPSPIERILRDLTFYLRHDNDDHILATIGRAALGETYDPSFHKQ